MTITESHIKRDGGSVDSSLGRSADERFSSVLESFKAASVIPQDPKMGAFFSASFDLASENPKFADFLKTALTRDITPSHFSNLFFRGVQYIEIFERGRTEYPDSFLEPSTWKKELMGKNGIITKNADILQEILTTKETGTTKYQRAAGVKAALNALFHNQQVDMADFGCGANYTLRGLNNDVPFQEDITYSGTPDGPIPLISNLLSSKVEIANGLAVDKKQVNNQEEHDWRVACSFYPEELSKKNVQTMNDLEARMANQDNQNIKFLQGDLLNLETNHADGTLPEGAFDAVIMSTILYQMNLAERVRTIDTAKRSLKPGGAIILQDFAIKDPTDPSGIKFSDEWGTPFTYRTFVLRNEPDATWQEFLQWNSGRCLKVRPGEDFEQVVHPPNIQETVIFPHSA